MFPKPKSKVDTEEVVLRLRSNEIKLKGTLTIPSNCKALVMFAHGSGSSRFSPRNQYVANILVEHQLATLLLDLLTPREEAIDLETTEFRFNIPLLAQRLEEATESIRNHEKIGQKHICYFGSSTGAAAALIASVAPENQIHAIVSRGGRPDLAERILPKISAPTLLIVGGSDFGVIDLNRKAYSLIKAEKKLEIVPDATHLFEEPGKLLIVAELAAKWFMEHS